MTISLFLARILRSIYDITMYDFMWTSWLISYNGYQYGYKYVYVPV